MEPVATMNILHKALKLTTMLNTCIAILQSMMKISDHAMFPFLAYACGFSGHCPQPNRYACVYTRMLAARPTGSSFRCCTTNNQASHI